MGDRSDIEWTQATWNPVTGCTKVSPGCKHCYAETFAERFRGVPGHPYEQGFDVKQWPERLSMPLRWTRSRRIFVNSMSDLFQDDVPWDFIDQVFFVMKEARQHWFQVLTKRAERMRQYATRWAELHGVLPNVALGVSAENQEYWTRRAPHLLASPAAVRFVSCEPLLDEIRPELESLKRLDWVIVGGESGPGARPMHLKWARRLVVRCQMTSTPVFVKQLGACAIDEENGIAGARLKVSDDVVALVSRRLKHAKGADMEEWPEILRVREWPAAFEVPRG